MGLGRKQKWRNYRLVIWIVLVAFVLSSVCFSVRQSVRLSASVCPLCLSLQPLSVSVKLCVSACVFGSV